MTPAPVKKQARIPWTQLIVIAILVALVIAVLIPAYGDYADRAQVSEAILLLGSTKAPLAEYYETHKKWPPSLANMLSEPGSKYVQSVAITKGAGGAGEIELTATLKTEGVDRRVAGKSVRLLSADGGKYWVCRAGTVREKTMPSGCRASQ
jgi:type IV pilus assembly protein PilA